MLDVLEEICTAPGRVTRTVVDLSTVGVEAARNACDRAPTRTTYVDAPVSGGRSGAVDATISIMWAGSAALLESNRPALDTIAKHVFYHDRHGGGQGQALKLLNNFLSATATAATGEAVLFGLTQGLDMKLVLDVVNVSTGRSHASADKYVNRVLSGTFDSGFATRLMAKDVRLFSEAAAAAGTPHAIGAAVRALWDALEADLPDGDHTEVFTFLRESRRMSLD